jgi:hypothetical protein
MDLPPARQAVHRSSRASPDRGPIGKIVSAAGHHIVSRSRTVMVRSLGRSRSLPRRACARGLRSSSALLSSLKRGAERRKAQGLARPHRPLRTASTRLRSVSGSRCDGDPRLSALHHGVFVRPSPTHLGPRLRIRVTGSFTRMVQQAPCARVLVPVRRGPRRPGSPASVAGRAGAVPASAKRRYPDWRPSTSRVRIPILRESVPVNPPAL